MEKKRRFEKNSSEERIAWGSVQGKGNERIAKPRKGKTTPTREGRERNTATIAKQPQKGDSGGEEHLGLDGGGFGRDRGKFTVPSL